MRRRLQKRQIARKSCLRNFTSAAIEIMTASRLSGSTPESSDAALLSVRSTSAAMPVKGVDLLRNASTAISFAALRTVGRLPLPQDFCEPQSGEASRVRFVEGQAPAAARSSP